MDVYKWLNDTKYGAAPESPQHNDPQRPRQDSDLLQQAPQRYRRKRARAGRSSSIIVPNQSYRNDARARHKRLPSTDHAHETNARPGRSSSPGPRTRRNAIPPAQRGTQQAAKTYERRVRHKTKPDKYEPKTNKRGGGRHGDKEVRKTSKRRERHHGVDGARTTSLVQSFQLKNGPKASRLTLRPDSNVGLFKHGRASAQLNGCGRGLPDLVFNEMKFLKQPQEHQDEALHSTRSPKRKLDRRPDPETYAHLGKNRVPADWPTPPSRKEQEQQMPDLIDIVPAGQVPPDRTDSRASQTAHPPRHNFPGISIQVGSHRPLSDDGGATTCFSWSKSIDSKHDDTQVQLGRSAPQHTGARRISSISNRFNDGFGGGTEVPQATARERSAYATCELSRQEPYSRKRSERFDHSLGPSKEFTSQSLPHLNQHQEAAGSNSHSDNHPNDQGWRTSDVLNINEMLKANHVPHDVQRSDPIDLSEPSSWSRHFWRAQGAMRDYVPVLDEQRHTGTHPALQIPDEEIDDLGMLRIYDGGVVNPSELHDATMPISPQLQDRRYLHLQGHQDLHGGEHFELYRPRLAEHRMRLYEPLSREETSFNLENEAMLFKPEYVYQQHDHVATNATAEQYEEPWVEHGLQDIGVGMQHQGDEATGISPTYSVSRQPSLWNGAVDIDQVRVGSSADVETNHAFSTSIGEDLNVIRTTDVDKTEELDSFWRPQKLW